MIDNKDSKSQSNAVENLSQSGKTYVIFNKILSFVLYSIFGLILLSFIISIFQALTFNGHSHHQQPEDRSHIGGIAKALVLYADDHNGIFPHKATSALSLKELVDTGFITDPNIFHSQNMPKLTPQQLLENATKGNSLLHNQFYYNYANTMRTDTEVTFCLGDAPSAWANATYPFINVAKCDGTTSDLDLDKDPAGAKATIDMVHPYRVNDRIYYQDVNLSGSAVDTWLEPASTTTMWFK
jgi:hypothetical protein